MKQDIKEKWLEYLRSGEYKQTDDWLHKNNSYCCLGVLCEVYECKWERISHVEGILYRTEEEKMDVLLPSRIKIDAGLSHEEENTLTTLNDSGKTFLEIADYIEANL